MKRPSPPTMKPVESTLNASLPGSQDNTVNPTPKLSVFWSLSDPCRRDFILPEGVTGPEYFLPDELVDGVYEELLLDVEFDHINHSDYPMTAREAKIIAKRFLQARLKKTVVEACVDKWTTKMRPFVVVDGSRIVLIHDLGLQISVVEQKLGSRKSRWRVVFEDVVCRQFQGATPCQS